MIYLLSGICVVDLRYHRRVFAWGDMKNRWRIQRLGNILGWGVSQRKGEAENDGMIQRAKVAKRGDDCVLCFMNYAYRMMARSTMSNCLPQGSLPQGSLPQGT